MPQKLWQKLCGASVIQTAYRKLFSTACLQGEKLLPQYGSCDKNLCNSTEKGLTQHVPCGNIYQCKPHKLGCFVKQAIAAHAGESG